MAPSVRLDGSSPAFYPSSSSSSRSPASLRYSVMEHPLQPQASLPPSGRKLTRSASGGSLAAPAANKPAPLGRSASESNIKGLTSPLKSTVSAWIEEDSKVATVGKSLSELFSCRDWSKASAMDVFFYNTGREARKLVTVDGKEMIDSWKAAIADAKRPTQSMFGTIGKVVSCATSMIVTLAYGFLKMATRMLKVVIATMPILLTAASIAAAGFGIAILAMTNPMLAVGIGVAVVALGMLALGFVINRISCEAKEPSDAEKAAQLTNGSHSTNIELDSPEQVQHRATLEENLRNF